MTSEELADEVEAFIVHAVTRVRGTGDDQYSKGGEQGFEGMNLDELFVWAEEELVDTVNYSVMLSIRLRRLQQQIATTIKEVANGTA
jgi:hypothetical protein